MPTTSNFGWTTPADTDLVKDGAAAIRTLGNGIDTSLVDLKGGTTGQILSKASNTDLDYTWINNDQGDITGVTAGTGLTGGGTTGAVTLTNDMATTITASGDIVVGTGNGTYDNLPIGTTGQVLTADTTVSPYKVKWAAPAGGGKVLQVLQATSTTQTSSTSATYADVTGLSQAITPSSASSKVLILCMTNYLYDLATSPAASLRAKFRLMRDSTSLGDESIESWGNPQLVFQHGVNFSYLDSPNTTASTTYKLQFARVSATGTAYANYAGTASIIVMEIGA